MAAFPKTSLILLVLSTLLLSSMLNTPCCLSAAQEPADQSLTDAVEDKIAVDRFVPLSRINIKTLSGIVTLTGTVNTIVEKERALRLAQTVRGVKSVINTIRVTPVRRTDAEIQNDVSMLISRNPALAARRLTVETNNAIVEVSGDVQSWPERDIAIKLAKSVNGVKEVRDKLMIRFPESRSDKDIMYDVVEALRWDALVARDRIAVNVENGRVSLSGSVGSAAEKARASNLARVRGVKDIDAAKLDVTVPKPGDQRKDVVVTDEQIRKAVEMALLVDLRTNQFRVSVEVKERIVILRGVVETLASKRAAEEDSRNTYGVRAVQNRLKVNPNQEIQDARIADYIRDALSKNSRLARYKIAVGVVGGIAYLSGAVDNHFEKNEAELMASHIRGVVDVKNGLVVLDTTPYLYDPYVDSNYIYLLGDQTSQKGNWNNEILLLQKVKKQLLWNPFLDADQIKVSVDKGTVTLTGTVDSKYAKEAAAKDALNGGATLVINKLKIE
ncbi:BON domain-containing protein [Pelotalea chapellei]|uniref:BON domain-containing protein n=1 Tax=Pelotalea chapellei TaxID=44671 RepID=A0ABS5U3W7_9BACT|nr:BON domain-containing protein [Pelotalea chapellei]MBT1070342.1 BON domain-containing protein [Pelotalea chapellei]